MTMRPRIVSTSFTEHSSFEESFMIENEVQLDPLTMKERIHEIEAELDEIEAETKDEAKANRKLTALVHEVIIYTYIIIIYIFKCYLLFR